MRIPIRTPGGFNVDRIVTGGAAFRPNYSYRRYFGRRVGQRVYGMPFSGGSQRPRGVPNARRSLFSVHPETRRKTRQTIEEVQDGTNYLLCNNTSKVSYLTYPAKSRSEFSSRVDSYIKLLSLSVSGSVVARHLDRSDGASGSGIHGIFTTVIVRDKRPCQFSAVDPLIPFADVFGLEKGACSTLRVRDQHRDRFSLVYQKKCVINTALPEHVFRFSYNVRFSSYPVYVAFKDTEDSEPTGLYGNVSKNALIVYYVWLCDASVTSEIHVKYDLNYIG